VNWISKITALWAVLMGVTAGVNLAIGNYATGAFVFILALCISYSVAKSCWLDGHITATKAATDDLKKLLDKLDEEKKQQPPEDWWKEGK